MVRTAEKIRSLLEEGEEMEEALETVKRAADENDGEVSWEDVQDEITSGQWGRIIEVGILESSENGFRFKYPDKVDQILGGEEIESEINLNIPDLDVDSDTAWTKYDKGAAVAAVFMMIGYLFDPVQDLIGNTVNVILGPFNDVLPFFAVILAAALFTGLISTLLQSNLADRDLMKAYQQRMKTVQDRREKAKEQGDEEAAEYFEQKQMEMATDQIEMFKAMFRPMVWIMLFVIPIFLWIWWAASQGSVGQTGEVDMVLPMIGEVDDWHDTVLGPLRTWIIWYIVCSISFSQILRKTLNIRMSMS